MIIYFFIGVLMSRCKTSSTTTKTSPPDNSTYISQITATMLHKADIINYCLKLLQSLLDYWRNVPDESATSQTGSNLLKEHLPHSPPDMTPFFLRQFVKGNLFFELVMCNRFKINSSRSRLRRFPNVSTTTHRDGAEAAVSSTQTLRSIGVREYRFRYRLV